MLAAAALQQDLVAALLVSYIAASAMQFPKNRAFVARGNAKLLLDTI